MKIDNFKIDSINLENYKKYKNINLELKNQFMLIVGENGSGKTSVLDGIATMLGGYLQSFSQIPTKERHSITKEDINITIIDKDENITSNYNTPVIISGKYNINKEQIDTKRLRYNAKGGESTKLLKSDNKKLIELVKKLDKNIEQSILPIISYHGTGRLWEQPSTKTSKMENLNRLDGYKDCLNAKSNYKNFIKWFEKMEFNSFQVEKKIPILEAVRDIVIKMLSMLTNKEVELFKYRESDLEFKYKDEEQREKVSTLSDGYKNMIGMVSDIAYRMAILNPDLKDRVTQETSGVVLIDEIDLHLHPKWQRKIVDILTELFPKVQFIATTHSPFIIQSIGENSIIKLDDLSSDILSVDATKLSIDDIAEDIQSIQTPQISKRKSDMLNAADKYFDILEKFENGEVDNKEVEKYKIQLDELLEPFEDNMAYVAFLRRERLISESKL